MEEFSFALAVVLTPPVIARESLRLFKSHSEATATQPSHLVQLALPGLLGMVCSFVAGLLALWLLSRWLEAGRWKLFGYYCLVAAIVVFGAGFCWVLKLAFLTWFQWQYETSRCPRLNEIQIAGHPRSDEGGSSPRKP